MTTTVCPSATSFWNDRSRTATSLGWRPIVGSSKRYRIFLPFLDEVEAQLDALELAAGEGGRRLAGSGAVQADFDRGRIFLMSGRRRRGSPG